MLKMSESERGSRTENFNLHSLNNMTNLLNSQSIQNSDENGEFEGNGGKKYKLRLKFDGTCSLEVVRLNGGHFQNLTHLDISGNNAEKLDLRSLTRLEWLCCSNNQLEILLLSGISLTYLDCSHNNLENVVVDPVPNNLSTLQLSFNNLRELPNWTWMIPELFIVYASHNELKSLELKYTNSLNYLPLRELHLHCNQISNVSRELLTRAIKLKILNLSQNKLESFPTLSRKSTLQELYLSRNRLYDSEENEALEFLLECYSLRRLHLAFNKIEKINERFTSVWKNLEELIVCGNRIRALPSKISLLTSLRVLRVHSNQLESVPPLLKMPLLRVVDLSHNCLRKINLENLISGGNLTYLDISCNERLDLHPDRIQSSKRPMNLVEVSNPRKSPLSSTVDIKNHRNSGEFPNNPPWELGFSELPDSNQSLTVTQHRDINLNHGREALFGLFDGGAKNTGVKGISKSIAKLYAEERNIEESLKLSLKYTLLNSLRNLRQQGNTKPMQGILCLLSMSQDSIKPSFTFHLAMVGDIRCVLIHTNHKITHLTPSSPTLIIENEDEEESKSKSENNINLIGLSHNKKLGTNSDSNSSKDVSIPDPVILSTPIPTSAQYLLIANKNFWATLSEREILTELESAPHEKSVLIAKRLTDLAQSHLCKQCLSLILVKFKWGNHLNSNNFDKTKKLGIINEYGPLSYSSEGSSDYSDELTNPIASITTPDSAIEADRSSGGGSIGSFESSKNKNSRRIKTITSEDKNSSSPDEVASIANSSVSQMSVEQFKCWEYMLEQNTRLLFQKELDTISKGVFGRNQKLRKSVQFPYMGSISNKIENSNSSSSVSNKLKSKHGTSIEPGFYSLSKAKSLSHLLANNSQNEPKDGANKSKFVKNEGKQGPKSHFPLFTNANAGFLESVKAVKPVVRGSILGGGPNAAYFGTRNGGESKFNIKKDEGERENKKINGRGTVVGKSKFYHSGDEIQELNSFDSVNEHDRLKKYWDNKITEL